MSNLSADPAALDADALGWVGRDARAPEVERLRAHLDANNGIVGLETVTHDCVDDAVRLFRRDGFVVVTDALDGAEMRWMALRCAGAFRYAEPRPPANPRALGGAQPL